MINWKTPFEALEIGMGRKICDGEDVAILSIGHVGNYAIAACDELKASGIHPEHYDLRFVKPIDQEILHQVFKKFKKIITVEDGTVIGGFGSAVIEFMNQHNYNSRIRTLGIPDSFIEQGTQRQLYKECGFDPAGIAESVRILWAD